MAEKWEKAKVSAKITINWNTGDMTQAAVTIKDPAGNRLITYADESNGATEPSPHRYEVRDSQNRTLCVGDDKPDVPAKATGEFAAALKEQQAGKLGVSSVLTTLDMMTVGADVELKPGAIPGICKTETKLPRK